MVSKARYRASSVFNEGIDMQVILSSDLIFELEIFEAARRPECFKARLCINEAEIQDLIRVGFLTGFGSEAVIWVYEFDRNIKVLSRALRSFLKY